MGKISEGLTYCQRTGKKYKAPKVNAVQKPSERRLKYAFMRHMGFTPSFARRARDYPRPIIDRIITDLSDAGLIQYEDLGNYKPT